MTYHKLVVQCRVTLRSQSKVHIQCAQGNYLDRRVAGQHSISYNWIDGAIWTKERKICFNYAEMLAHHELSKHIPSFKSDLEIVCFVKKN